MQLSEHDFLLKVLCGDRAATAFCEELFWISQLLDDLIDKDKPRSDTDIVKAFHIALIALPDNPFYRAHFDHLRPMLALALQAYADASQLERMPDAHTVSLAFVLRDLLTDVVTQCARLVGGYDHAQAVSIEIRLRFHDETLGDYSKALPTKEKEEGDL